MTIEELIDVASAQKVMTMQLVSYYSDIYRANKFSKAEANTMLAGLKAENARLSSIELRLQQLDKQAAQSIAQLGGIYG